MVSAEQQLAREPRYFLEHLRTLARGVQERVIASTRASSSEDLARAVHHRGGDVVYALDLHADSLLQTSCERWGHQMPFLLIAEGLEGGHRMVPYGAAKSQARFTMIVDPVDGTRGLMYGKRSGWFLCAVAPPPVGQGVPTLDDIWIALQAELPTPRAALADTVWAVRGESLGGETLELASGATSPYVPTPSSSPTLEGGFASICKFFPGTLTAAAELEEALFEEVFGPPGVTPQAFNDAYISTGGQLYELMSGRDRFVADLRPLLISNGSPASQLTCHPYDLCTWIIAQEAGVIVTDGHGKRPTAPLDTETPVSWIGYANDAIRESVEPTLQRLLSARIGGAATAV